MVTNFKSRSDRPTPVSTPVAAHSDSVPLTRESAELAERYRTATSSRQRTGCPTAAKLFELADGQLSGSDKRGVVLHLADCSECSVEVQALRRAPSGTPEAVASAEAAGSDGASTGDEPGVVSSAFPKTPARAWLLAASLLMVVASAVWFFSVRQPNLDDAIRSSDQLELSTHVKPPPDSILKAPPLGLEWGGDAGSFELRLMTAEGDVVVEATGSGNSLSFGELEPQVRDQLLMDGRFLWTVVADSGDRLGPYWFEITPPSSNSGS